MSKSPSRTEQPGAQEMVLISVKGTSTTFGLPTFTLTPRQASGAKTLAVEGSGSTADTVPSAANVETRTYGGHTVTVTGSMSKAGQGLPAFPLDASSEEKVPGAGDRRRG